MTVVAMRWSSLSMLGEFRIRHNFVLPRLFCLVHGFVGILDQVFTGHLFKSMGNTDTDRYLQVRKRRKRELFHFLSGTFRFLFCIRFIGPEKHGYYFLSA